MDTGDLIRDDSGAQMVREIRALRAEVEALKRAGFALEAGAPDPGGLLSAAGAAKLNALPTFGNATTSVLLGNASAQEIGTNEVVGRTSTGGVDGIPVASQSVLGRAASGITALSASASTVMARQSSGDVGFQAVATWAADAGILTGAPWPVETVTGNVTLNANTVLAILNHSADTTITLPTPTASGKVVIVADPNGKITPSTAEVRFATSGGSDTINGATGNTTFRSTAYLVFVFVCLLASGPVARWTGRQLNVAA